jgi:hypothetical protein
MQRNRVTPLAVWMLIVLVGCAAEAGKRGKSSGSREIPYDRDVKLELFLEQGGRVAWYHGDKHELIAYDTIVDRRFNTQVYTIEPDGSSKTCVTCDSNVPVGFVGQPSWHPNGEQLLIQVENEHSEHKALNFMSFGIDNDLWIVRRDGSGGEMIYSPVKHGAVLHPHCSPDGKQVIFAERVPTGRWQKRLDGITPGGENHWEGWQIHVADFRRAGEGTGKLANHRTFRPSGAGFYETHGFDPDGRILYSFTSKGQAFVDDIYSVGPQGDDPRVEVEGASSWDEHGVYSPDGKRMAFMSSRLNRTTGRSSASPTSTSV